MLIRVFLFVALLLAGLSAPATAMFPRGHVPFPPGVCQKPVDNGCSTSPGGSVQILNLLTGYTGTTYAVNPGFNVPVLDYSVGVPSSVNGAYTPPSWGPSTVVGTCTGTQDPLTATQSNNSDNPGCGIIPQHCTVTPTTLTGGQLDIVLWSCGSTSNTVVVRGFECGSVGGHGPCYFNTPTSLTGDFVIAYNDMPLDAASYAQFGIVNLTAGSTEKFYFFGNTLNGQWVSKFSSVANGQGTMSGTTLNITSCTSCNFALGQSITGTGIPANARLLAKGTGTGGTGTYTLSQSATLGSIAVHGEFNMGNAMSLNTGGDICFGYNAILQVNGRIATAQQRASGGSNTVVNNVCNKYNYVESGMYTSYGIHYEMIEYILGNGTNSMTWNTMENTGNVFYLPSALAGSSVTSNSYISTGNVAGGVGAGFITTYAHVIENNNIAIGNGGVQSQGVLFTTDSNTDRSRYITTLDMNNNYVSLGVGSFYAECNGAPSIGGVLQQTFVSASDNGAGVYTVATWQGGVIMQVGMHSVETKGYITAQLTGTGGATCPDVTCTGKEGTYSITDSVVSGTSNKRLAMDSIQTVNASGNVDLNTGSSVPLATFLHRDTTSGTGGGICAYPGFTTRNIPRDLAANDNVKDADRRKAA